MKAISINAYEIENDDGETLVFMTPKEFDFIKKQNDLKNKENERLNSIIKEVREYMNKHEIEEVYLDCKLYETKVYKDILEILDKVDKEKE